MSESTLRVAISGAAGRMGKTLIQAASLTDDIEVGLALERPGHSSVGDDAGTLAGLGEIGVAVTDAYDSGSFDTLIEFATPDAAMQHVERCVADNKSIVIGATGFNDEQKLSLSRASEFIRILVAPNMSAGVNITLKLIEMAAAAFGDNVDIEVIEAHHKAKVDAPSGTALRMGEVIAESLGRNLDRDGVFQRHGITGPRTDGTIGFSTIRGGDIVGDHTVMFIGQGERVEITHRSNSRMNYASGSMRAAKWLVNQPPGLYDLADVLGLNR